jgi:hypothetical protein
MPRIFMNPSESLSETRPTTFDARIPAVEIWIAGLPLANVHETCRLVLNALSEINTKELLLHQHFKVLELFRSPILYLSDALKRQFINASIPFSPKVNKVSSLLHSIQLEMAKGYRCISDELQDVDNLHQDFLQLATSFHRGLYFLGQALLTSYQTYSPALPHLWSTIHQIYAAAERKGLQTSLVKDLYEQHSQETTVEAQYKQILLLALADPNHLSQAAMAQVYSLLDQWAPLCRLSPVDLVDESLNNYVVDLEGDSPPAYLIFSAAPHNASCRFLDTTVLIQTLRALLPNNPPEFPKPETQPLGQQTDILWKDLLRHLLANWGMATKRGFTRLRRKIEPIELVFGLSSCHQLLGEASIANHNASFTHRSPTRTLGKIASFGESSSTHGVVTHNCALLNESANGACIKWQASDSGKMRVGELLALCNSNPPGQAWGIAVIRWLKTLGDRSVEFGIQLLAPDAIPVAVRLYSEEETGRDYLNSLLLPEIKATRRPASLIVPAFLYHVDDVVSLRKDNQEHRLRLINTLETNRIFSCFQFSQVS